MPQIKDFVVRKANDALTNVLVLPQWERVRFFKPADLHQVRNQKLPFAARPQLLFASFS